MISHSIQDYLFMEYSPLSIFNSIYFLFI